MTINASNVVIGEKSYLALASEDIWGFNPYEASGSGSGAQNYVHVPVNSYTVRLRNDRRNATPAIGLRQRKHGRNYRGMPSGQMTGYLYGAYPEGIGASHAEYLLDWAFESWESLALPSKTARWAEGPDTANKEHVGLRVNSATLTGSADSGVIEYTIDLMGLDEDGNADTSVPPIPNDREKLVEFEFADATLSFGPVGSAVTVEMDSFTWSVQNNLQVRYNNSRRPSVIAPAGRVETFQFSLVKQDDVYDSLRRATSAAGAKTLYTATLTLKGLHSGTFGTGNYAQVAIAFPCLDYVDHEDAGGFGAIALQPLQFDVLKPDTASNGSTLTWSTPS